MSWAAPPRGDHLGRDLDGAAVFIGVVGRSVAGLDYLSNNDAENIFIDAATSYLPPILAASPARACWPRRSRPPIRIC